MVPVTAREVPTRRQLSHCNCATTFTMVPSYVWGWREAPAVVGISDCLEGAEGARHQARDSVPPSPTPSECFKLAVQTSPSARSIMRIYSGALLLRSA